MVETSALHIPSQTNGGSAGLTEFGRNDSLGEPVPLEIWLQAALRVVGETTNASPIQPSSFLFSCHSVLTSIFGNMIPSYEFIYN